MLPLLDPVGLGSAESDLYLALLDHPHATATELARRNGISTSRIRRVLARLIGCGLVTRLAGDPTRYLPAPPELAIGALALRRQQELEKLRAVARDLSHRLDRAPRGAPSELVELVEGQDAVRRHLDRIQLGAEAQVCIIDCPPYLTGQPIDNPPQWQAMSRGVNYRCIYHAPSIAEHRRTSEILRYIEAGEQARTLPDINMKMIIADRRIALIPLSFAEADTGVRILVHPSPLLSALIACFDMLWDRATPLGPDPDRTIEPGGPAKADRQTLAMLAAGLKDHAIARALGITERTVTRRVTSLMKTLNATTRFQAALQATRRGWL